MTKAKSKSKPATNAPEISPELLRTAKKLAAMAPISRDVLFGKLSVPLPPDNPEAVEQALKKARSELISVHRRVVRLTERAAFRVIQPLNDVTNHLHRILNELEQIIGSALAVAILSPPYRDTSDAFQGKDRHLRHSRKRRPGRR